MYNIKATFFELLGKVCLKFGKLRYSLQSVGYGEFNRHTVWFLNSPVLWI